MCRDAVPGSFHNLWCGIVGCVRYRLSDRHIRGWYWMSIPSISMYSLKRIDSDNKLIFNMNYNVDHLLIIVEKDNYLDEGLRPGPKTLPARWFSSWQLYKYKLFLCSLIDSNFIGEIQDPRVVSEYATKLILT